MSGENAGKQTAMYSARPAYSSINFGLLPAEVILVGAEMSVGMASRVMAEFVILPSAKRKSYNAGLSWGR